MQQHRSLLHVAVTAAVLALLAPGSSPVWADEPVDPEFERLKALANQVHAVLETSERTFQREGLEAVETNFHIDTATRKYTLRYKTFAGADAAQNPGKLNDWASGYGMILPHSCWYQNGLLKDVGLIGPDASVYIMATEGRPIVVVPHGPRVAYDLVFTRPEGTVVVRTVALAGRDELFISISGRLAEGEANTLRVEFYGFPQGFTAPFDRWVHGDGQDIQNAGAERQQFPWDLTAPGTWMLLCDHAKAPDESHMGPLGILYDRRALTGGAVLHNRNYAVLPLFTGPGSAEQRYILYTFAPMKWEDARDRLAAVEDAEELLRRAFDGLPPLLEQ